MSLPQQSACFKTDESYELSLKRKDFTDNKIPDSEKIAVFNNDNFIGIFKTIEDKQILAKPEFVLQPIK